MSRQVPLDEIPIRYVKGVGPARAARLKRLGAVSVADVLLAVPRRYEDRRHLMSIRDLIQGQQATLKVRILAKSLRRIRGGRALVEAAMGDETGVMSCLWFNQPYLAAQLRVGEECILYGQVEMGSRGPQIMHPEMERIDGEPGEAAIHTGRIVPIYPLTEGIGQRWFRGLVRAVLTQHAASAVELLSNEVRERHELKPIAWALEQIHFPDDEETLHQAQRRLVFEELFVMQVRLALRRARWTSKEKLRRYRAEGPLVSAFIQGLPFALTAGQQHVLAELVEDLCKPTPMLRLLQGEVGCGKTVVAAALTAVVVQSGYQVALMVPSELLAEQHHRVLTGYFRALGVSVRLLSQALSETQRKTVIQEIGRGTVDVAVGTHALIESAVSFPKLGLVIIDEQHKFGVVQRSALAKKAQEPDVLVMTATPIPRTLALSLYGDLAYSTMTELPPGRQPIRTIWRQESDRADVYRVIREELRRGRQGYVVYPLITDPAQGRGLLFESHELRSTESPRSSGPATGSILPPRPLSARRDVEEMLRSNISVEATDRQGMKAATQMARTLQEQVFPEFRVELLHGQMRPKQKEAVMRAFAQGRIHLLVSTVIVEVGLDVPNATVLLIEHPERFGLAQLHQLRGRIGRGVHAASCVLLSDAADPLACARLRAFVEISDGFRLAEQDLKLRGPGELLGRHQHGWLQLRIAHLARDQEVLEAARQEAFALVERSPSLAGPEWTALRQRLGKRLERAA